MSFSYAIVKPDVIRDLRSLYHWSRDKLARLCGFNPNSLARIERQQDMAQVQWSTLETLARVFGVKPDDLTNLDLTAKELYQLSVQYKAEKQAAVPAANPEPEPEPTPNETEPEKPVAASPSVPAPNPVPVSALQRELRDMALSLFSRPDFTQQDYDEMITLLNVMYEAART